MRGGISTKGCKLPLHVPEVEQSKNVHLRLTIRPTERCNEGEYWIAIIGHNIDAELLSTNQDEFVNLVRKLTGFQSLEIGKFMSLTNYRYAVIFFPREMS